MIDYIIEFGNNCVHCVCMYMCVLVVLMSFQSRLMQGKGSSMIRKVFRGYLQPTLLLLCVAGGFRQGGGLVWAYNVKAYFYQYYCGTVNVGEYLSWIPLVGGTIGAVVGGFVSDRLAKSRGDTARLWVLVISQVRADQLLLWQRSYSLSHSACSRPLLTRHHLSPSGTLGFPLPHPSLCHRGDVDWSMSGHCDQHGSTGYFTCHRGTLPVHH